MAETLPLQSSKEFNTSLSSPKATIASGKPASTGKSSAKKSSSSLFGEENSTENRKAANAVSPLKKAMAELSTSNRQENQRDSVHPTDQISRIQALQCSKPPISPAKPPHLTSPSKANKALGLSNKNELFNSPLKKLREPEPLLDENPDRQVSRGWVAAVMSLGCAATPPPQHTHTGQKGHT